MNYYEAIKAKALHSVLKPDTEYYIRRIIRWYSKTFHTPIQAVQEIPVEYILREYFEERYENMEEEDRDIELEEITETEEQRKERLAQEDAEKNSEHQLMEMARQTNKARKIANKNLPKTPITKLPEQISKLSETIKDVAERIKEEMKTDPQEMPPDIDMKFESDSDFEKMLNSDSNLMSVDDKKP